MNANEFAGTLYRSTGEMLDAIAHEWLSARGENSDNARAQILHAQTDDDLAAECISGWELSMPGEREFDAEIGEYVSAPSHMEFNVYTSGDLARSFARLR